MMMKSVFWWRKPEYPEETTDLRQVTDETFHTYCLCPVRGWNDDDADDDDDDDDDEISFPVEETGAVARRNHPHSKGVNL